MSGQESQNLILQRGMNIKNLSNPEQFYLVPGVAGKV